MSFPIEGIIDSHAHLAFEAYADDQAEVIRRARAEHVVQMIQAGVELQAIPEMVALAEKYPFIYIAVGLHPHEAKNWQDNSAQILKEAARHQKTVAIGECGLDFYYNLSERQCQLEVFARQVALARELGKPLVVHTRDAWDPTFEILKRVGGGEVQGVFHCFTGSPEVLPKIRELDFYVSFSGIVTFKNAQAIQDAAALVAEDRLMVETDCPYLAPQPVRGKRNEPRYVWMVAEKLAALRHCDLAHIARTTSDNARRLFRLPAS